MEKSEIQTERNVVIETLKIYRKLPNLWNPTHKLYTNKNARRKGLEIMLQSWRKLEPNATVETMRKKLNNWRASFRRERKKVEVSEASAAEPDEIHKPNLWYYDYLTFLNDEFPILSKEEGEDDQNMTFDFYTEVNVEECDAKDESENIEDEEEDSEGRDDDNDTDEEPEKKPRMSSKRKSNEELSKQVFSTTDSSQKAAHSYGETSADLFGRAIGSQLKEVSKLQRCLAEKLISEIMFYAKLDQLTIGTSISLDIPNS